MGYLSPGGYSLRLHHASISPLDTSTYYFGGTGLAWTTAGNHSRVYVPKAGIIRAITYYQYCTHGTTEAVAYYIRINGATDYIINDSFQIDSDDTLVSNYNLAIPVQQGDYLEIKVVTPAWVTNPTGILGGGHIVIE